jgi:hypothetical protein
MMKAKTPLKGAKVAIILKRLYKFLTGDVLPIRSFNLSLSQKKSWSLKL